MWKMEVDFLHRLSVSNGGNRSDVCYARDGTRRNRDKIVSITLDYLTKLIIILLEVSVGLLSLSLTMNGN